MEKISITNIPLPNNAIKITEYADDISLYNCTLAVVPIILMIISILIFKLKKYSIKCEQLDIEFYNPLFPWENLELELSHPDDLEDNIFF